MSRNLLCSLVLAPVLVVAGCGGDGDGTAVDPALLALADCTAQGMADVVAITDALPDLLDTILDPLAPPSPNVTFDLLTGDFTLGIDVDGDTVVDATATGTVTLIGDFTDGAQVGEGVTVDWSVADPDLTGSGTFDFTLAPLGVMDMAGVGSVSPDQACTVDITAIDLSFDLLSQDPDPVGTVDFSTSNGIDDLTGTVTMSASYYASVDALFRGVPVSFSIDLRTFAPRF